jgi:hypothetical protein
MRTLKTVCYFGIAVYYAAQYSPLAVAYVVLAVVELLPRKSNNHSKI